MLEVKICQITCLSWENASNGMNWPNAQTRGTVSEKHLRK